MHNFLCIWLFKFSIVQWIDILSMSTFIEILFFPRNNLVTINNPNKPFISIKLGLFFQNQLIHINLWSRGFCGLLKYLILRNNVSVEKSVAVMDSPFWWVKVTFQGVWHKVFWHREILHLYLKFTMMKVHESLDAKEKCQHDLSYRSKNKYVRIFMEDASIYNIIFLPHIFINHWVSFVYPLLFLIIYGKYHYAQSVMKDYFLLQRFFL